MSDETLPSNISLCDALDRILSKGVVAYGDIAISVAGVDLLYIGLRGLICAVDALQESMSVEMPGMGPGVEDQPGLAPGGSEGRGYERFFGTGGRQHSRAVSTHTSRGIECRECS